MKKIPPYSHKFIEPFFFIVLVGIIAYLGSTIGRIHEERRDIEFLTEDSKPRGVFEIPEVVKSKKWEKLSLGSDGVFLKYPANWRIQNTLQNTIIREGEDAIAAFDILDAGAVGESMLAYRVARISALQELKYTIQSIEETSLNNQTALVLNFYDATGGSDVFETAFLHGGSFYIITLLMKNERIENEKENIVREYKDMLGTMYVP